MKNLIVIVLVALSLSSFSETPGLKKSRSCSVICLNGQWLIKSYEKKEHCKILQGSKGSLSVKETLDISNKKSCNGKGLIEFKVAILRKSFNTMEMFSNQTFSTVKIEEVLEACEKGDQIMIILEHTDKYSLPHHAIEVI